MFHLIFLVARFFFKISIETKKSRSKIESSLNEGVTIVCDRYSFSGVAFSGAKDGMNMEWLKGPEEGLLAPDRVIYLDIDVEVSLMFLFNITHMDRTTTHTHTQTVFESTWRIWSGEI